jgi:hypothetical protein
LYHIGRRIAIRRNNGNGFEQHCPSKIQPMPARP